MDLAGFVRAHTTVGTPALVPEVRLHLAGEAIDLWRRTDDELREVGGGLPYWGFAWAGGIGLARYVLDHPETVAGCRVLDVGTGSGLVAIAAALAGAATVTAVDVDPVAVVAAELNAALCDVVLDVRSTDVLDEPTVDADVVLAGDVSYEQPMAGRASAFLGRMAATGATVVLGDPGRTHLPGAGLVALSVLDVPVPPTLEGSTSRRVTVYRVSAQ